MKGSVRMKLLVPSIAMLVLCMGVSSYFSSQKSAHEASQVLVGTARLAAQDVSKNLDDMLSFVCNVLALESGNEILDGLLTDKGPSESEFNDGVKLLKKLVATSNLVSAARVYNTQGKCIVSDTGITNIDVKDRDYFKKVMAGQTNISNPLINRANNLPVCVISTPIIREGKITGALIVGIDLSPFTENMIAPIKIGEKGYVYLVDGNGITVSHPDAAQIMKLDISRFEWGRKMLSTGNGSTEYLFDGHGKTAVYAKVKSTGWIVCAIVSEDDTTAVARVIWTSSMVLSGVGVGLVCLILIFIVNPILAALQKCVAFSEAVTMGDLGKQLEINRTDELGKLGRSLSIMVEKLKEMVATAEIKTTESEEQTRKAKIAMEQAESARRQAEEAKREGMLAAAGQLEEVVSIISSASTQLSAQIAQSHQTTQESAQCLAEAADAMNQMTAAVHDVAASASSASSMSEKTKANAEDGANIVRESLQSIAKVNEVSMELKKDMTQLNEHAQAINRIMGVISDIADQTNLLALNAAIEAARAGDAGRGFAVVADEVRKLAEKTMTSTQDVGNAITAIQSSTTKSVSGMDNALQQVETATGCAGKSREALQLIVSDVESTAGQVRAIAVACEQQSAASEAINNSIEHANSMSEQTTQAMTESARAVADLAQQAQKLSALIREMKNG